MDIKQIREVQKNLDNALYEVIKENPGKKCAWYIAHPSVIDLARADMDANNAAKSVHRRLEGGAGLSRSFDRSASRLKARKLIWSTNQTWSAR